MEYRIYRIFTGFILPPILGSVFLIYWMTNWYSSPKTAGAKKPSHDYTGFDDFFIFTVGFAFLFVGLQSIISTLIMEFVVFEKTDLKGAWLFWGVVMGILSGLTLIGLGIGFVMVLIGALVGLITAAALIKILSIEAKNG